MGGIEPKLMSDFAYVGSVVSYTVSVTGTYYVVTSGAEGGAGEGNPYGSDSMPGGLGGQVAGDIVLVQGETLEIAVGGEGDAPSGFDGTYHIGAGGGGGASYLVLLGTGGDTLLEAAGGGAGGGFNSSGSLTAGEAGGLHYSGDGEGGTSVGNGGGGGGFYGNGAATTTVTANTVPAGGGGGFVNGLAGGDPGYTTNNQLFSGGAGGFGGGGGGSSGIGTGGGGGGYSGGTSGEGGTSYVSPLATRDALTPGIQAGNGDITISLECFVQGARIATPLGRVNVETLNPGDIVLSERRGPILVHRIGSYYIDCSSHPDPLKVYPVLIRAGAFGANLPVRNLRLSPGHSVFINGVLIPIRVLVNGRNVVRQKVSAVTYWHIEVDEHDVLLAEGLPVESYLDVAGHLAFADNRVVTMASDFSSRVWEAKGCAPLRVRGPEVEAVRDLLLDRVDASGKKRPRHSNILDHSVP